MIDNPHPPEPAMKTGRVQCDLCDHIWTAKRPESQTSLECPNCGHHGEVEELD